MLFDRYRRDIPNGPEAVARLRSRIFRHAPHVVWTSLRGETVVFDIERGKYESLNEVATSVWEQLADGSTFDSIVASIGEQYELPPDVPADQVVTDVAALLLRLEKARVIVAEPLTMVAHS